MSACWSCKASTRGRTHRPCRSAGDWCGLRRQGGWASTRLAADIGLEIVDFLPEGRDGTGRKTRVPWLRFGSRARSPSATEGFYVVYLFDALGNAVYLSLNQGTTDFARGEFVPKPARVIEARVSWARRVVGAWMSGRPDLAAVDLHDPGLGAGYERGNIAALAYERGAVPTDTVLLRDARAFASALGRLYAAHDRRPLPYEVPEVNRAVAGAEEAAGKPHRPGGGFRTNAAEIKAIEEHAVRLARAYYEARGWRIRELGKPFDLELTTEDEQITVEVKGTTSDGSGVPLTEGEVRHHAKAYPQNALVVVRGIELDRSTMPATCSGGTLYEQRGWMIDGADLRPISYSYAVPPALFAGDGVSANRLLPRAGDADAHTAGLLESSTFNGGRSS